VTPEGYQAIKRCEDGREVHGGSGNRLNPALSLEVAYDLINGDPTGDWELRPLGEVTCVFSETEKEGREKKKKAEREKRRTMEERCSRHTY
jgi:hypothetical protein